MSPDNWRKAKARLTVIARLPLTDQESALAALFPGDPAARHECAEIVAAFRRATERFDLPLGHEPHVDRGREGATDGEAPRRNNPAQSRIASSDDTTSAVGATPPDTPDPPLLSPGARVGRYRTVRLLGAGGMGQVYLADDPELRRRVALKVMGARWSEVEARRRLLEEARAASGLSHAGIAAIHDVLDGGTRPVIVMEYVEGRPLSDLIAEGPLPVGFALRLAIQLADAMSYAHDRGILHCDLKPANVQLTPDRTAKILDFGLARARFTESGEPSRGRTGPLFGTPCYMAPEQIEGRRATVASEVYSLGVVLFELLTGCLPFDASDPPTSLADILHTPPPAPSSLVPSLPAAVDGVTLRALAKAPDRRIQSARELGGALRETLALLDSALPPSPSTSVPVSASLVAEDARLRKRRRTQAIRRFAVSPAGVVAALGLITFPGFISSQILNQGLGRTGRFSENALLWPAFGMQGLVAPLVAATALWVACSAAALVARRLYRRAYPTRADSVSLASALSPEALASAVVGAHLVALAVFVWLFSDVLAGIVAFITDSSASSYTMLALDRYPRHRMYRWCTTAMLMMFGTAWAVALSRVILAAAVLPVSAFVAGALLFLINVGLWAAPHRLLYQNTGERVHYGSEGCYVTGRSDDDVLIYCPAKTPPRSLIVSEGDPGLDMRGASPEEIFEGL